MTIVVSKLSGKYLARYFSGNSSGYGKVDDLDSDLTKVYFPTTSVSSVSISLQGYDDLVTPHYSPQIRDFIPDIFFEGLLCLS